MKHLLILGAGGMGKEIYYTALHTNGYGTEFDVKGFLDFPNPNWDSNKYPPLLGIEDEYEIQPDDVFTCSIGDVNLRRKVCEKMKSRGAKFQTLIDFRAEMHENVIIGDGCIINSYATVGAEAVLGENCFIQSYSCVAHDCRLGDYCRLDVRSLLVGGVVLGNNVTVHTNAIVSHKVTVGDNAVVGALSFVIRSVKPNTTVCGNPAVRLKY